MGGSIDKKWIYSPGGSEKREFRSGASLGCVANGLRVGFLFYRTVLLIRLTARGESYRPADPFVRALPLLPQVAFGPISYQGPL